MDRSLWTSDLKHHDYIFNKQKAEKKELQVISDIDRKSLSVNINYGIRLQNQAEADTFIQNCAKELSERLQNEKLLGQKITLKLKVRDPKAPVNPKKFGGHGICQNVSSSKNMKKPTDDADVIATESCQLLLKLKVNPVELRGIGLQLSLLTPSFEDEKLSKNKTNGSFCPSPSKSKITNFVVRSPKKLRSSNLKNDIQSNNYSLKTPCSDQPSATKLTINNVQKIEKEFLSFLPEAMRLEVKQNIGLQKNLLNKVNFKETESNTELSKSFLNELPEDIKNEVVENITEQKDLLEKAKPRETLPKVDLNNSFLTKLPEDIRMEVIENLDQQQRDLIVMHGPTTTTTMVNKIKKSRRKRRNLKLKRQLRTNMRITQIFDKVDSDVESELSSSQKSEPEYCINLKPLDEDIKPPKKLADKQQSTYGKKKNLNEIRNTLRNWVCSCTEGMPFLSDVNNVSLFFSKMVLERENLDVVSKSLKTLHRYINNMIPHTVSTNIDNNTDHISWVDAYRNIVNTIQASLDRRFPKTILDLPTL